MLDLREMWKRQMTQQETLFANQQIDAEVMTKEFVINMIDEVMGIVNCTNYKVHRLVRQPFVRDKMLEELVDVFKYLLSIALLHNITPEEFFEQFVIKSDLVDARWIAEQALLQEGAEVIGVDLDGCVADYVTGFKMYVEQQGYTIQPGQPCAFNFSHAFDIDQQTLEQLKEGFEESGGFATLPTYPEAVEVLHKLRCLDYKIIIVTSRRQHHAFRLYQDTSQWLKEHDIPCDMLLFSGNKSDALQRNISPAKCLWFVEDHDKYAFELASDGVPVLLLARLYNGKLQHENIVRVKDWGEIYDIITTGSEL